jgi:hypothetical protein
MWDSIDTLSAIDPSGNNKYLDWLSKNLLRTTIKWFKDNPGRGWYSWTAEEVPNTAEDPRWSENRNFRNNFSSINNSDLLQVQDDIDYFHKNPSKYEKKDINQFANTKELEDATNEAKLKLSRKEQKETGVDKVYEDDDFLLLMPKTHKASCRYGSNTRWCITMRGYTGYYENYLSQGPIFFLIDKRKLSPTKSMDTPNYYKVAIQYRPFKASLGRGDIALKKASTMTREEFLAGADIANTAFDYWNVADDNKSESVVKKFLGGPGKGQTKKGEEAITKLKEVMEKYTKEEMGKYYDSLGDMKDDVEKRKEIENKLREIRNKRSNSSGKLDNIRNVKNRIEQAIRYYNRDTEEDLEYFNWMNGQIETSEKFENQVITQIRSLDNQINNLESKLGELNSKMEKKYLVFYDPEKNVSISR